MNKHLFFVLLVLGLVACGQEAKQDTEQAATASQADPEMKTGKELMDELKSKAVDEDDLLGRLEGSLNPLKEEYAKSEPQMAALDKVVLSIDKDCNFTIENAANGKSVTKVNLNNLDPEGFGLIPDLAAGEFPGLRIKSLNDAPVVEEYRNGQLVNKNNELVIYLATRESIERITPVMLQMLYLCQGKYE